MNTSCLNPKDLRFSALSGQPSVNAFVENATNTAVQPPRGSEFAMNFIFHVFILFFALTMLFKFIIGPLESQSVTNELGDKATESINASFETMGKQLRNGQMEFLKNIRVKFNILIANLKQAALDSARQKVQDASQSFDLAESALMSDVRKPVQTAFDNLTEKLLALSGLDKSFQSLGDDVSSITDNALSRLTLFAGENVLPFLKRLSAKYSKPDEATVEHNKGVLNTAYFILAILGIVLIVLVSTLAGGGLNMKKPILHVLFENLIVFGVVGAAEYMFFINVASKFVPVVPSQLSTDVLSALQNEFPAPAPA